MNGYYELKKTEAEKFHFTLKAANHEVILSSQHYAEKANALKGIESVRSHGSKDEYFERKVSAKEQPYFSLKAANGQMIGTSQMYSSEAMRDNGIASVINNASTPELKDLSA